MSAEVHARTHAGLNPRTWSDRGEGKREFRFGVRKREGVHVDSCFNDSGDLVGVTMTTQSFFRNGKFYIVLVSLFFN